MPDPSNINVNLTPDDLVRLINATTYRKETKVAIAPMNLGDGDAQNSVTDVQPLWCGIIACGGSIGIEK